MVRKEGRRVARPAVVERAAVGVGGEDEAGRVVGLICFSLMGGSLIVGSLIGSHVQTAGGFNGLIRLVSSATTSSVESPTRSSSVQSGCGEGPRQVSFSFASFSSAGKGLVGCLWFRV
jgi:hypothetical protein